MRDRLAEAKKKAEASLPPPTEYNPEMPTGIMSALKEIWKGAKKLGEMSDRNKQIREKMKEDLGLDEDEMRNLEEGAKRQRDIGDKPSSGRDSADDPEDRRIDLGNGKSFDPTTGQVSTGGAPGSGIGTGGTTGAAEQQLLDMVMEVYKNPNVQPANVLKKQLADVDRTRTVRQEASNRFKQEMDQIAGTQGVGLSLGGTPIVNTGGQRATIKPMRQIQTAADLAKARLSGTLGAEEGIAGAQRDMFNQLFTTPIQQQQFFTGTRTNAPIAPREPEKPKEPSLFDKLVGVLF